MACHVCGLSSEEFGKLRAQVAHLEAEIDRGDRQLGFKDREISRLKKEQAEKLKHDERYQDAEAVLRYWQEKLAPNSREPMSPVRIRAVFGRLGDKSKPHYTPIQLMRCVDGYAAFPYSGEYGRRMTSGRPDQRKVEAEFIFRDDRHVMQGLALLEQATQHHEAFTAPHSNGLSELGYRALHLAKLGWNVFPCQVDAKAPATRNGLLDAKTDAEAITRAWTARPEANLAVRTGVESGIVVLDVDGDEGYASLRKLTQKYDDLPTTLSVVTPRGGQHFYFQHPGNTIRNTVGVPGPGLDIRGDGGYVLVPPSKVGGKRYEVDESTHPAPMPSWLIRLLVAYHERTASKIEQGEWAQLISECASPGQRNDMLTRIVGHWLGPLHMRPDEAYALALKLNRDYRPPLDDREVERVVVSIAKCEVRKPARRTDVV